MFPAGAGIVGICLLALPLCFFCTCPSKSVETGETFKNLLVNFLGPKLQDKIKSGLSKYKACPSASIKPYIKGIGRYRLRTPAFSPESVSSHSLQ